MSRIAFISDIHGNLHALRAVLTEIDAYQVDEIVCLGDVVGYGPEPGACLELVHERCATVIRGNHEEAVLAPAQARTFNSYARAAIKWTCGTLTQTHFDLINEMPTWARLRAGLGCVHDSPVPLADPGYLRTTRDAEIALGAMEHQWCFIGHTHIPAVFALNAGHDAREARRLVPFPGSPMRLDTNVRYIMNPGSVGQPRDGDWRASWGLLELELDRSHFTIQRVAYEVAAVEHAICSAGLPEPLGSRLRIGA